MAPSHITTPPPLPLFTVGEVLSGTYEIRSLLGEGARGQVFEAHDRALNRKVAIKVALPDSPPEAIRKEAQALAAIRHPGMVSVYALGVHREVAYVVMERLYGTSLEAYLDRYRMRRERMPAEEAIDVLIAVTDVLSAVHRAGIAHRDVKPANVMLSPGNRVVLVDLGMFLPEFDLKNQTMISGSPPYIAPESIQRTASPGEGHLVDLYALGAMAFEMLTGDPPFLADTVREVLKMHLRTPVPDLASERTDLPPRLVSLIKDLLAKDPRERPQSGDAVLYALRRIRDVPKAPTKKVSREKGRLSVLVVDDDRDIARVLGFYVRKAVPDAEIRTAHDGDAAVALVREKEPDLMLLDLHMPRTNGLEVCMLLRGAGLAESCTIVSVSAGAQTDDVQLLRQLGVTEVIPKGALLGEKVAAVAREVAKRTRA